MSARSARSRRGAAAGGEPVLEIVRWRDIPAQVIARHQGETVKRALAERFAEAIDRAAMRGGAREADAYLADWRRDPPAACDADIERAVAEVAGRLEAAYDDARLAALVVAGGYERPDDGA